MQVAQAIAAAVEQGLELPIVYNTSAYDGLPSLRLMEGLVDVYMPDFKFWTPEAAYKYAKARDYPDAAKAAILEMHRQVRVGHVEPSMTGCKTRRVNSSSSSSSSSNSNICGLPSILHHLVCRGECAGRETLCCCLVALQVGDLVFSADGLAKRGLLLRHLVMPGMVQEAKSILDWVVEHLGTDTYVNIMEQYHPNFAVNRGEKRSRLGWTDYSEIGRRPGEAEVEEVREYARSLGLWRFEEAPRYEALGMEGAPPGLAA
jgi:putative pyruvate formate lyase activating enzyme